MVKFYPEQLISFDTDSDLVVGTLPAALITFFRPVTSVIDPIALIICFGSCPFSFYKNGNWGWLMLEIWSYMDFD